MSSLPGLAAPEPSGGIARLGPEPGSLETARTTTRRLLPCLAPFGGWRFRVSDSPLGFPEGATIALATVA
jgi:hypothetical protein